MEGFLLLHTETPACLPGSHHEQTDRVPVPEMNDIHEVSGHAFWVFPVSQGGDVEAAPLGLRIRPVSQRLREASTAATFTMRLPGYLANCGQRGHQ